MALLRLVDGGLDAVKAAKLCSKIKPETLTVELAPAWVKRLQNDDTLLDTILESGSDVSADFSNTDS